MSHATTESRLAALESDVAQLKLRLDSPNSSQASSGASAGRLLIDGLPSRGVLVQHSAGLKVYLDLHPDMVTPLDAAIQAAQARLPEGTELSLDLYRNPEIADEYPTLYARRVDYEIDLMGPIDEVSSQLEAAFAGRSGHFLLTTDFAPPIGGRGGNGI